MGICKMHMEIKYNKNNTKVKQINLKSWQRVHFIKEIFAFILVSNGYVLFKFLSSNVLDQSILGFNHSVPNLRSQPAILESSLIVKPCCRFGRIGNFSLRHAGMSTSQGYKMKGIKKRN